MFTCLAIVLGLFVTLPLAIAYTGTRREVRTLLQAGAKSSRINNARLRALTLQALLTYMVLFSILSLISEWTPIFVDSERPWIDPPPEWFSVLGRIGLSLVPTGAFAVFMLYIYPKQFDRFLASLPKSRVANYALLVLNVAMGCDLLWTRGLNP
jgi:hypothetical protein